MKGWNFLSLSNSTTWYIGIVISKVWPWHGHTQRGSLNRRVLTTHPRLYADFICDKSGDTVHWEKDHPLLGWLAFVLKNNAI